MRKILLIVGILIVFGYLLSIFQLIRITKQPINYQNSQNKLLSSSLNYQRSRWQILPLPKIEFADYQINFNSELIISGPKLEANLSIWSLILGKLTINGLSSPDETNIIIEQYELQNFNKLIANLDLPINFELNNIKFNYDINPNFSDFSLLIKNNKKHQEIIANANYNQQPIKLTSTINLVDKTINQLLISKKDIVIFELIKSQQPETPLQLLGKISNLNQLFSDSLAIDFINQPIELVVNFKKNSPFSIQEVIINSNNINLIANLADHDNQIANLDIKINKLDLVSLISSTKKGAVDYYQFFLLLIKFKQLITNINLAVDIEISNIHTPTKLIDQAWINLLFNDQQIKLTNLLLNNQQENIIFAEANLAYQQSQSRLVGKINIVAKQTELLNNLFNNQQLIKNEEKYYLESAVSISEQKIAFTNLLIKNDKDNLRGSLIIDLSKNSMIEIYLNSSQLNLSNHNLLSKLINLARLVDISIFINSSVAMINQLAVNNFTFNLDYYQGKIINSKINFDSESFSLEGKVKLVVQDLRPTVLVDITKLKISNNDNFELITSLIKQSINQLRIDNFSWLININSNYLKYFNIEFLNTNIKANYSDNLLNIEDFASNILNGQLKIKSSINLSQPVKMNGIFSVVNIDLAQLKKISLLTNLGYLSTSGSVISQGRNLAELLANIQANASFAIRDLLINGISLEDLYLLANSNTKDDYQKKLLNCLNSGSTRIINLDGKLLLKDQLLTSQQITFNTQHMNANLAFAFNVNFLLVNSIASLAFIPNYSKQPINVVIKFSGPINNMQRTIDDKQLTDYLSLNH